MQSVKVALRTKAVGDGALIAILGGPRVYHRVPQNPTIFPRVTYFLVSGVHDEELPKADEIYQFDGWSKTADENDAIAERLDVLFHRQPLVITGRRLAEIIHLPRQEFYESEIEVHHIVVPFRVVSYAA